MWRNLWRRHRGRDHLLGCRYWLQQPHQRSWTYFNVLLAIFHFGTLNYEGRHHLQPQQAVAVVCQMPSASFLLLPIPVWGAFRRKFNQFIKQITPDSPFCVQGEVRKHVWNINDAHVREFWECGFLAALRCNQMKNIFHWLIAAAFHA